MKLANFAETQMQAFAALEKRFAAKPTRETADGLAKETFATRIGHIEARIDRLESHKTATLARIDASLASEREALGAIKRLAAGLTGSVAKPEPKTKTKPAKVAKVAKAKA